MKSLPKSLETVRSELIASANSSETKIIVGTVFDVGVAAVLQSAELKGLVEALRIGETIEQVCESGGLKIHENNKWASKALYKWQEWIKE